MTKAELVEEVASQSDLTKKDAEVIVQTVLDSITNSLQRGEKNRASRIRIFPDPQSVFATGEESQDWHRGERPSKKSSLLQTRKGT